MKKKLSLLCNDLFFPRKFREQMMDRKFYGYFKNAVFDIVTKYSFDLIMTFKFK